ncbi:MAG: 3-hydroxyacyl-CoA dehydrogenase NAD-binding domain-containing protein, partial [Verrucomicrobiota bacterium]
MSKNITLQELDGGIVQLVFDRAKSSANIFDVATMTELNHHLDTLDGRDDIQGLILTSAKSKIFIAGADINELLDPNITDELLSEMVKAGQQTFHRIARLPYPTVATIHGASLGGGFEIALACDYRIASPDRSTRIGLPETQLGILPAWGGCARLPRLIGIPKALDAILGGKRMPAKQAEKYGMVDLVVPREHFERTARKQIARGKPMRGLHFMTNNKVAVHIARKQASKMLWSKTRGNYPAVKEALNVITGGVDQSMERAFDLERRATVRLVKTHACKNLVRIFFLQEKAKKLAPAGKKRDRWNPNRVAVVGAGVMGGGIAQWTASRGIPVTLRDINEQQVLKGMAGISKLFHSAVKRRLFTKVEAARHMDRITPAGSEVPLTGTDMVIEAAVEHMPIKKQIFARLAEISRPDTILATNTSALSVSELAESVPKPGRVVGIHFFNPVHRMQLVEVVKGKLTSPETLDRTVQFVQQLGKLPVVVKDSPGFVVNRILMPYMNEAGILFETGASPSKIDKVM